jgi:hypothetical protein
MAINGEVPAKQLLAVEHKSLGAGQLQLVMNKVHLYRAVTHAK